MERLGYRPGLDGLRAIAIALVVDTHFFACPFNGIAGVDLFFVLSGFLITTLILDEHRNKGSVSLFGFYARRVRRLVPALVTLLAAYAIISGLRGQFAPTHLIGGVTFTTNLVVAFGGASIVPLALGHLWSLGAEEQFYVMWPLLLIAAAKRPRLLIAPLLAVVCFAMYRDLTFQVTTDQTIDHLYFGPDTRSVGPLAVGCLAALLVALHRDRTLRISRLVWLPAFGVAALIAFKHVDPYRGWLLIFAICSAILVLAALGDTHLSAILSFRPISYVGRISYSLYLWHAMILVLLGGIATSLGLRVAGLTLAVALAVASYHLIEQPFRHRGRGQGRSNRRGGAPTPAIAET